MQIFGNFLQQTPAYGWLYVPSAVLLGALHGLEPGHAKTLMAAYIVAIRGTIGQAILLGLAATVSHTAIVWIVALLGLNLGQRFSGAALEPVLQLVAGAVTMGIALWMIWHTWRSTRRPHDHDHDHDHDHHDHDHTHEHGDAHARAHAAQLRRELPQGRASNGQIALFGLTGGLVPCPASVTVLMLCLQSRQVGLGASLVLCFSVGLAFTLVASGVVASVGLRHVASRLPNFDRLAARAPYLSGALMLIVGIYMGWLGGGRLLGA
jgi:ABC-type nickel/cobalt efflux system permease component RcnA